MTPVALLLQACADVIREPSEATLAALERAAWDVARRHQLHVVEIVGAANDDSTSPELRGRLYRALRRLNGDAMEVAA